MGSYEDAIKELKEQGIVVENKIEDKQNSIDDGVIYGIKQATGVEFSEEQEAILRYHGNMVIIACAGSGKTTVLNSLLAKRIWSREIVDPSKVLCTTYSNAGAKEMKERLKKLLKQCNIELEVDVRTMHSFYSLLLRTFNMKTNLISNKDRLLYIKDACKEADYICKDDDLQVIDSLLSFQVNNILKDKETVESFACTLDDITPEQYKMIRKGYDLRKVKAGLIDYDDMQLYMYKWLCKDTKSDNENVRAIGESVRNYCRAMWDHFYIDETQDISKIQNEIMMAIITNPVNGIVDKELVVVGDDDQCIYKWRGADPDIILTIGANCNLATKMLCTNYRCKNEIVDFAANSVKHNSYRHRKSIKAYSNGGSVEISAMSKYDLVEISKEAVAIIKENIAKGYELKDIAILARNNFHLSILGNMLLKDGINCINSDSSKLTKSYMYNDIKNLVKLCEYTSKTDVTRNILWKLARFLGVKNAATFARFQSDQCLTLVDALKYMFANFFKDYGVKLDKTLNVSTRAEQSLFYFSSKLKGETVNDLYQLVLCLDYKDNIDKLRSLANRYMDCTSFMYKNEDKERSIKSLIKYICYELTDGKTFEEFKEYLRVTEQLESGKMRLTGDSITLSTMHGSKGREWKNVIVLACDNVTMPGLSNIETMYEKGITDKDVYSYIDEERRLYYVACTRAKDKLNIITSYMNPSVFLLESLGEFDDVSGNNDTIINLVNDRSLLVNYLGKFEEDVVSSDGKYHKDVITSKKDK